MLYCKIQKVKTKKSEKFRVVVCGSKKKFESFCKGCQTCDTECNQCVFVDCINTREEAVMVFANMKEAKECIRALSFYYIKI